jgi:maltooligosyltrehalose trehalohydrolase
MSTYIKADHFFNETNTPEKVMIKGSGIGATYLGNSRTRFSVWAPFRQQVDVHILAPYEQIIPLIKDKKGYFHAVADNVLDGSLYKYLLDRQTEYPDPASHFQPHGVHGPSQVLDTGFHWDDNKWSGLPLKDYIIYELHTGTFSTAGTFDAIINHLNSLAELGITALELMPVAQFPGSRNWGYDGVYPYAVQDSYGGPDGLKRLVNACHWKGLAVVLDVVYNHLGPEGNHLAEFGPYFTDKYQTPWGDALNFDGAHSDHVRRFFIENALRWVTEFHIDALRLDALHAIADNSAYTFIEELADSVHRRARELSRNIYLIGESAVNDARLIRSRERGGYGLDAQWNDDLHHSLHVLLTGENTGYYQDFGDLQQLAKAYTEGFVYSGEYSAFRKRRHGTSSRDIPAYRFVVFSQNHDQVGNRAGGERLGRLVPFESLKVAASVILLSPFIPLLFMGEEYGEIAPFPYFVSHIDPELIEAVRQGRLEEFTAFKWQGEIPDPQEPATFASAKLDPELRYSGKHQALYNLYRELIRLRRETPALGCLSKDNIEVLADGTKKTLFVRRWQGDSEVAIIYNLSNEEAKVTFHITKGSWRKLLDSADKQWHGDGSTIGAELEVNGELALTLTPQSFVLIGRIV